MKTEKRQVFCSKRVDLGVGGHGEPRSLKCGTEYYGGLVLCEDCDPKSSKNIIKAALVLLDEAKDILKREGYLGWLDDYDQFKEFTDEVL